ncbi:MAG: hypothetical protein JOS17DRAFT_741243 [Linnemannia elongata]|nr:MAG: hypothetical protein JOS17DRAFT_741243 [Linnemannia elongata]
MSCEAPITLCFDCRKHFAPNGLESVLPVPFHWRSKQTSVYLCLDCRLKEFDNNKEPLPPAVETYQDPLYGSEVVPRITAIEAREQYCLEVGISTNLPFKFGYPVRSSINSYTAKMYEEKDIVREARWMYGGDIGIANARKVYTDRGHQVKLPPSVDVRMRRNRIREAFLTKELFAAPELTLVRSYVEFGRGKLQEIVEILTD